VIRSYLREKERKSLYRKGGMGDIVQERGKREPRGREDPGEGEQQKNVHG
jgi:hypothetical protein